MFNADEGTFLPWAHANLPLMLGELAPHFPFTLSRSAMVEDALADFLRHVSARKTIRAELDALMPILDSTEARRKLQQRLRPFIEDQLKYLRLTIVKMVSNIVKTNSNLRAAQDDIVQDIHVELCKRNADFDPARGSVYSWLKGLCLNVVRKKAGKYALVGGENTDANAVASREAAPDALCVEQDQVDARRDIDALARKVLANSDCDQRIFQRHFIAGDPAGAIAQELRMSVEAVYQRIHRIPKKLRASGLFDHLE